MKKLFLLLIIGLFVNYFAKAQATESNVDYQKKPQSAASIELPYSSNIIEDAIKDKMKRSGYKVNESKGFLIFSGVRDSISGKELDYVYKVERKSRRDKESSIVYLFAQGANADMLKTGLGSDMESMKINLNSFIPHIDSYNLEQQINDQDNQVKKAEKELDKLQDKQRKLEKEKKKLENDLANNLKDQEKQRNEIENQRKILETFKSKRKN